MKNNIAILFFTLIFVQPLSICAEPSDEAIVKMSKDCAEEHNGKIPLNIRKLEKVYAGWPHDLEKKYKGTNILISDKKAEYPKTRLDMKEAFKYGIPSKRLNALYQVTVDEKLFLVAHYVSEIMNENSYSDIYLKVGKSFKKQFHSFDPSLCLLKLGEKSPIFFSNHIAGGDGWGLELYTLKKNFSPKGVSKANNFNLVFHLWLWHGGYILYKDLDHDGNIELISITDIEMPYDLMNRICKRMHISQTEASGAFGGPWGAETSVYKWDGTKFVDLGDYLTPY